MNSSIDLTLIPIEDLVKEIAKRTDNFVIGYTRTVDNDAPIIFIDSSGKSYLTALGLCREIEEYIIFKTRPNKE